MIQDISKLLVVIGSAKAGTSAFASWLDSQPMFRLGQEKEPRFFTDFHTRRWQGPGAEIFTASLVSTPEAYRRNFPGLEPDTWAVDASVDYIWSEGSLERIQAFSAGREVKVIAILRDPVARAVSEYNHTLRGGNETLSFRAALEAEAERARDGFQPLFLHQRRSRVHDDIHRAKALFGDDLLILDYAQMGDPAAVLRQVGPFLGVEDFTVPEPERRNESYLPRNALARGLLQSGGLRQAARRLVPQRLRRAVWQGLHANARTLETVSAAEKAEFRSLLADEIAACAACDLIPTGNWTQALPQAG